MSVKLADTLAPMSDFPVAEAKDVSIEISGSDKSLQQAYEDGDLGGGDTIQVTTMPLASVDNLGQIVEYVGANGTYTNGYFYQCVSDGETPATYSWTQKNVQPSNATANDVSYDNTTSELEADNVQEAIDEVVAGLGTASGKDYTDTVRPNSHDLVESGSVYSAINNALSTIYMPRGDLSCADLTSALLIEANIGNVYTMSDSGLTSALFINGAGITINANDNVGIIKAGQNTILFNYMGNAFDLHDYQKKDLTQAVEGQTTVEGALGLLEYKSSMFPGTKAEYEALSADEKKKYDYLASPETVDGEFDVYSTTETKTNKVWIDGKPIYRKVITGLSFGDKTGGFWASTGATLENVSVLTTVFGIRVDKAIFYFNFRVDQNNAVLYSQDLADYTTVNALVVEYTKAD